MTSTLLPILFGMDMGNDTMGMDMTLHMGDREIILFSWWKTGSILGFAGSMLIIFLLAVLYEALRALRMWIAVADARECRLRRRAAASADDSQSSGGGDAFSTATLIFTQSPASSIKMRFLHSFLHAMQSLLGFVLMLIVMTFNSWLILTIVFGLFVGFFLFSGSPHVEDSTGGDCC